MKKLCLSLLVLLMAASAIKAEDGFSVNAPTIPQGGVAELEIVFESETAMYNRFQLEVQMPEGITYVQDAVGDVTCAKGALIASTNHDISASHVASQGLERFICVSMNNRLIPAGKGVIMTVTYKADASLNVGDELTGYVKNVIYNDTESHEYKVESIPFTITIGEARVLLDENSTTAPEAAENVNVRVKRTINANEWSTICLPFEMTTEQVEAAFGELGTDVLLADFKGYETTEDNDENIVGISVKFDKATTIEANHPYLIKVSEAVSSFTVDGVDIDPEDEPTVAAVKRTKKQWSEFIGTYQAQTVLEAQMLFLYGNKFYYSNGATKMKAFRGYFDFYDVLTEVEEATAASRIFFVYNGGTTSIGEISTPNVLQGAVYNLNGQFMGADVDLKSLPKGIYMVDGKKVVNY